MKTAAAPARAKSGPFQVVPPPGAVEEIHFIDSIPFIIAHIGCLLVLFVPVSPVAVFVAAFLYFVRMFGITGAYHRYFSHRSYSTSRIFQFCLGFLGCTAAQMGPLWWASHHRHHHRHSDTEHDIHSPIMHGLWWSHFGWILARRNQKTNHASIQDLTRYPELEWLDRHYLVPPALLGIGTFGLGLLLERFLPGLGTSGPQMLVWGFFVSTVLLYHGTFCINSLAHIIGTRRFETNDHSRNSFILALVTLGEGWHNNHHRFPISERQGIYWWEIDITHYILRAFSLFGLVWDLRTPSPKIYAEARRNREKNRAA